MADNNNNTGLASGANEGTLFNKFLGALKRLGVHLIIFLVAMIVVKVSAIVPGMHWASLLFSSYVGLLCLFPNPKEKLTTREYYLPTLFGFLTLMGFVVTGASLCAAVLAGGVTTYVVRLIRYRRNFGFDFATLPFLLISIFLWSERLDSSFANGVVLLVFVLLGIIVYTISSKFRDKQVLKENIKVAISSFKSLRDEKLDDTLTLELNRLIDVLLKFDESASDLQKEQLASKVVLVLKRAFSYRNMQRIKKDNRSLERTYDDLLVSLKTLSSDIESALRDITINSKVYQEFSEFVESAKKLLAKKDYLPESVQPVLDSIADSTLKMVKHMQDDPADKTTGISFFKRYLKHTHSVLDEYSRLKKLDVSSDANEQAFNRAHEVLDRLGKAFLNEYEFMLKNDTVNFTAELNALDSFMKMHGHN